jgi:hypothetical protein
MQNQTEPNRVYLTKEQAVSMLPDGDTIHTFLSNSIALIGADWDRIKIIKAIADCKCEIGGEACKAMNHGLVVHAGDLPLFVECKKDFDYDAFELRVSNPDMADRNECIELMRKYVDDPEQLRDAVIAFLEIYDNDPSELVAFPLS